MLAMTTKKVSLLVIVSVLVLLAVAGVIDDVVAAATYLRSGRSRPLQRRRAWVQLHNLPGRVDPCCYRPAHVRKENLGER
jgi:hypothetical protein